MRITPDTREEAVRIIAEVMPVGATLDLPEGNIWRAEERYWEVTIYAEPEESWRIGLAEPNAQMMIYDEAHAGADALAGMGHHTAYGKLPPGV